MKVKDVRVEDLTPYENNPRWNDAAVDAVAASISDFGFKVPIVIDKNNVVAAGHTRLKAAEKLGLETVPCIIADDLSEEQIKAFRLADNKTGELAEWNFEALDLELLEIEDIDMGRYGFTVEEPEDPEDIIEDNYDEDEEQIEKRAKEGQIWKLGDHRLMCGDSTSPEALAKLMDGEKADFVFTDPPYGVSVGDKNKMLNEHTNPKTGKKLGGRCETNIKNDTLTTKELYAVLVKAFEVLRKNCTDECSFYISSPQGGELGLMMLEMMKDAGLPVRHNLIWVKNAAAFSMGRLDYDYRHEPIFYTWTKSHKFYGGYSNTVIDDTTPIDKMTKAELKDLVRALKQEKDDSVIYCDKPTKCDLHPTMKPIKLIARFMINSSQKEDKVLDIFGGSGSTMIAAEQLGRRCYMMELDPHYCDVILDRFEKFTGKKAELING